MRMGTSNVSSSAAAGHIASLDGLRALSILIVFFAHAFHSLPIPGGLGVTIFFFISGYLITILLLREVASNGRINFVDFYIRRFFRLAPPLLLTLLIGIFLVLIGWTEGTLNPLGLISQILFFFNYWDDVAREPDVISGAKIFWSLSVEEHFYLIFPLILALLIETRRVVAILSVIALIALPWRYIKLSYFEFNEWQIYSLTDTRFDSILWGCVLGVLVGFYPKAVGRFSQRTWMFAALVGALLILMSLIVRESTFRSTFRYTLQSLSLIPIFYYALNFEGTLFFSILNNSFMKTIGKYSYTIYLSHYIIINAIIFNKIVSGELRIAIVSGLLTLLYSAAMYHAIEVPARKWRISINRRLERMAVKHSKGTALRRMDSYD